MQYDSINLIFASRIKNTVLKGSFYLDNSKVHLIYSQPKWDSNENRFREKKSENSQATDWDCNKVINYYYYLS